MGLEAFNKVDILHQISIHFWTGENSKNILRTNLGIGPENQLTTGMYWH